MIINLIIGIIMYEHKREHTKEILDQELFLQQMHYRNIIRSFEDNADIFYLNRLYTSPVLALMKEANSEDEGIKNSARQALYALLKEPYNAMRSFKLKHLHFHLPNNESFLRFHRPTMFGDDLTPVRSTVVYVNKTLQPMSGFEEGRIFNGYRFVYPLVEHGNHYGSVEASVSMQYIVQRLRQHNRLDVEFIIRKDIVEKKVFANEQSNYEATPISQDYLYEKSISYGGNKTIEILLKEYDGIDAYLQAGKAVSFPITYDNTIYINTLLPLIHPVNKTVTAYVIVSHQSDALMSEVIDFYTVVITTFLFFTILVLLYYFSNRSQEHIQKKNDTLKHMQKVAQLGSWELDLLTNHLVWSDEIYTLFELDKTKFLATYEAFLEAIHPDDRQMVNEAYSNSLVTQQSYSIEHRLLMKDGKIKWVREECESTFDAQGNPVRSIGTVQDISAYKELTLRLEYLNQKLEETIINRTKALQKATVQSTAIADKYAMLLQGLGGKFVVYSHTFEGTLLFISEGVESVFGIKQEDAIGQNYITLIEWTKNSIENSQHLIEQLIDQKSTLLQTELSFRHPNGQERYIRGSGYAAFDEQGELQSINGILEDITEHKQLEFALIEEKERAQEATRAKSYFLANMSHEIRTPMNGILGMSHLALRTSLDEKQRNYLNMINTSANTLLGIINDILDISKIEAGKLTIDKTNFDLFRVVESVIALVEGKAVNKALDVIVEYDTSIGKIVYGDSLRVNQVLTNLLSNAVKFTHEGEVCCSVMRVNDQRIRFEVSDTGIGLSPEQLEHVFDSFTQADATTTKKYGGTGLGLTITKELIGLMNGTIDVESKLGEGSRFIVELELINHDKKEPFAHFEGKRALVVDDHPTWLIVLEHLLESFGIEVDGVSSGVEAVTLLKTTAKSYDLFLIDWNMQGLNGIQTCQAMHQQMQIDKHKMILVSAYKEEILSEAIEEAGLDKYLHKPVNPSELNQMLGELFLEGYEPRELHMLETSDTLQEALRTLAGSKILLAEDNRINQEIILDALSDSGIVVDIAHNGEEAVKEFKNDQYDLVLMDIQMPLLDGFGATKAIRQMNQKVPLSEDLKVVLFERLATALESKRVRNIQLVMDELEGVVLDDEDAKRFEKIAKLVKQFKFKQALEILV
jgi:PAS domain S-box-containing protein